MLKRSRGRSATLADILMHLRFAGAAQLPVSRHCGFDSAMVERKAQNDGRLVTPGGEQFRPILILEAP
jgi:hypothetical protein